MTTAELLKNSEQTPYGIEQTEISSDGKDIFVISDLHLAAGVNTNSNYAGTENFFADEAFCRFMTNRNNLLEGKPAILIINGDFIDFFRIENYPETNNEFAEWQQALQEIGINKTIDELKNSVSKKEKEYGLKTHDYKSVYKMFVCSQGHKQVFDGLGEWLAQGHQLVIVKGNHDLEFYWKAIRDFMRLVFAKRVAVVKNISVEDALKIVLPLVVFADDKLVIDKKIYFEHGHRYDNFSSVDGTPVLENSEELNLPFGAFFNRYLINRIELAYPHIDDVRPRQNILPILIRERFPLAVKLLFCYVPFAFKVIPKKQYLYAFRYLLQFLFVIVLPVLIVLAAIYFSLPHPVRLPSVNTSGFWGMIISQLKNTGLLVLSYFFGRLMSMLQIKEIGYLDKYADEIFAKSDFQFIIFGHTHNPQQLNAKNSDEKRYYNTGTWMPVFEMDTGDVRENKTYPYLHFTHNSSGEKVPKLMRWNDDALRAEPLFLIEKK